MTTLQEFETELRTHNWEDANSTDPRIWGKEQKARVLLWRKAGTLGDAFCALAAKYEEEHLHEAS